MVENAPIFPLGSTQIFGEGKHGIAALGKGWSKPEVYHVWSDAHMSYINFRTRVPHGGLNLTLEASPFLAAGVLEKQRIDLIANGLFVAHAVWREPETKSFFVPSNFILSHEITFLLVNKDCQSPLELGIGDDSRMLGLALRSLSIAG